MRSEGEIFNVKNKYGYCSYSFEEDYVHIYNLFVYPEFRMQGRARSLLSCAIKEIKETGYAGEIQIVAQPSFGCAISKEKLKSFYEKLGLTVFEYYG